MFLLGIDPDRGWAVADHSKDRRLIIEAGSVNGVSQMAKKIRSLAARYKIECVRIERSAGRGVYTRPGTTEKAMKKIAVNVGENRAKAEAIFWFCEGLGLNPQFVNPVRNGTKLSSRQIESLTGWTGRTNEHVRDAIVIAWV